MGGSVSLGIHVYNQDEEEDPRAEVWYRPFGIEITRTTIWSLPAVRALGLTWLSQLAEVPSIDVQDEDLAELEDDARVVLAHLDIFGPDGSDERQYVRQRLDYLLEACAFAKSLGAG